MRTIFIYSPHHTDFTTTPAAGGRLGLEVHPWTKDGLLTINVLFIDVCSRWIAENPWRKLQLNFILLLACHIPSRLKITALSYWPLIEWEWGLYKKKTLPYWPSNSEVKWQGHANICIFPMARIMRSWLAFPFIFNFAYKP